MKESVLNEGRRKLYRLSSYIFKVLHLEEDISVSVYKNKVICNSSSACSSQREKIIKKGDS